MSSHEQAEGQQASHTSRLVVLSPRLGPLGYTGLWFRGYVEGQRLIAIPRLYMEHVPSMMIAGGQGLGLIFLESSVSTKLWDEPAGFVGGSWKLWRTSRPELHGVGFVLGEPKFDIEKAVRGVAKLLKE